MERLHPMPRPTKRSTQSPASSSYDATCSGNMLSFPVPARNIRFVHVGTPMTRRRRTSTNTTFLPEWLRDEDVLTYPAAEYDFHGAEVDILRRCDVDIVGGFQSS